MNKISHSIIAGAVVATLAVPSLSFAGELGTTEINPKTDNVIRSASTMPYAILDDLEESYPDFGNRPWEESVYYAKSLQEQSISTECSLQDEQDIISGNDYKDKMLKSIKEGLAAQSSLSSNITTGTTSSSGSSSSYSFTPTWSKTAAITASSEDEAKGKAVIDYAKQFVGLRYVWGGSSLKTGLDCSGFTMKVYQHFGINLPHYSYSQANYGTEVASLKDAIPGDLIIYPNHVALYAGNNTILHASRGGVQFKKGAGYLKILTIRRIIGTKTDTSKQKNWKKYNIKSNTKKNDKKTEKKKTKKTKKKTKKKETKETKQTAPVTKEIKDTSIPDVSIPKEEPKQEVTQEQEPVKEEPTIDQSAE